MGIGQRSRLAGAAAVALLAAGCFWSSPDADPGRTKHNVFEDEITPETVGDLEEIWTATTDPGAMWGLATSNRGVHFVRRSGGELYLYGIDRGTGSEMWRTTLEFPESPDMFLDVSAPIFAHDAVWVGYGFGEAAGQWRTSLVDPDSGEEIGRGPGGLVDGVRGNRYVMRVFSVTSSPPSGGLYVGVGDLEDPEVGWYSAIYGGDLTSGLGDPGLMTLGHNSVYQAGIGFFEPGTGSTENGLRSYAIEGPDSCGEQQPCFPTWAVELDGTNATTPVVASQDGGVDDATVFTTTNAGTVYAVDATSGDVEWSISVGGSAGSPALADGRLYVPTSGKLVVLDASSGDTLWETSAGGGPSVAGGVVYAAGGGNVYAFDATGCGEAVCDPLWSATTGGTISRRPAIDRGHLYIGTTDGRLIAYGLPE